MRDFLARLKSWWGGLTDEQRERINTFGQVFAIYAAGYVTCWLLT